MTFIWELPASPSYPPLQNLQAEPQPQKLVPIWVIWSRRPSDPLHAPAIIISPHAHPPDDIVRSALQLQTPPPTPPPPLFPPLSPSETQEHETNSVPELPNEIVQQIFFFAVFATALSTKEPALFPWFLGHICSTWRCIFLSMTTEFWHEILIYLKNDERMVNIVRFFLERGMASPLSFWVESFDDPDDPRADDYKRQIMEMLADESMRWEDVSIYLDLQDFLSLIRIKNRLPLSNYTSYSKIPLP